MNTKILKLSLVISLLAGAAFLQTAHAQAVDHSTHMHGDGASAGGGDHSHGGEASAGGEGNGKHHDGKDQNIVVRLGHFDAANWEDPFPGGHNWQPACMAVMMANHMLGEKTHVTLFLDLQGVELADTDNGSDLSGYACMMGTLQEGWDNLVSNDADIVVCPGCAAIGDVTEETLRDGAHIADGASEVSRIFLEADKVIDY